MAFPSSHDVSPIAIIVACTIDADWRGVAVQPVRMQQPQGVPEFMAHNRQSKGPVNEGSARDAADPRKTSPAACVRLREHVYKSCVERQIGAGRRRCFLALSLDRGGIARGAQDRD